LRDHHPPDFTAATRIAAALNSPWRHDQACPVPQRQLVAVVRQEDEDSLNTSSSEERCEDTKIRRAITELKLVLDRSSYNNKHVQRIFGISPGNDDSSNKDKAKMLSFSQGPVYLKPVTAGEQIPLPFHLEDLAAGGGGDESLDDTNESSFQCLVALFLLGFAVPKAILSKGLIGGDDTIALLEYLGLAFPCENDPSIIVPYVHLFPMDVNIVADDIQEIPDDKSDDSTIDQRQRETITQNNPRRNAVIFVTDCHPTVLSRTTVGTMEDGAVMYIGPDSLALVQHIPLQTHMTTHIRNNECGASEQTSEGTTSSPLFAVLDFCSGSGVQAISTLVSLKDVEADATAVCVDVNDRALRFSRFNALLNGISDDRIRTVKADLISGKLLPQEQYIDAMAGISNRPNYTDSCDSDDADLLETLMCLVSPHESQSAFDIILANPPFIPVPPSQHINNQDGSNPNHMHLSDSITKRYGLFSSGGAGGEDVLQSIMIMSSTLIRKDGGLLAVVSEFMNPPTVNGEIDALYHTDDFKLLEKIERWWNLGSSNSYDSRDPTLAEGNGILFTNQYPVSAATYATRRADNKAEFGTWFHHMESEQIHSVSPGLMFVGMHDMERHLKDTKKSRLGRGQLSLSHQIVPKTESGSIWTPSNMNAIAFTSKKWVESITSIN